MKRKFNNNRIILKIFLFKSSYKFKMRINFKFFLRYLIITKTLNKQQIQIYNGKQWKIFFLHKWMYGYKLGEFFLTRKYTIFKKNRKKKKK